MFLKLHTLALPLHTRHTSTYYLNSRIIVFLVIVPSDFENIFERSRMEFPFLRREQLARRIGMSTFPRCHPNGILFLKKISLVIFTLKVRRQRAPLQRHI